MRPPERTRQELDPVGAFSTRIVTIGTALSAFIYATAVVVVHLDVISSPGFALLALLTIGAATVIATSATDPYRGPFHRVRHGWVVTLSLAASALLAASIWGSPSFFAVGSTGPVALGLYSISIAPYRPVRELVGYATLSAVFMGFISLLQAQATPIAGVPPVAVVGVHVLPLLALTLGAAAFTNGMIGAVERWRKAVGEAVDRMSEEQQSGIARSVQQDRVTILNREVVPFFSQVLEGEEVTDEVRERARSIADAVRSVMVAEVDRTWLENLVDHLRSRVRHEGETPDLTQVVFDVDNVANLMTYDQRTALRALLIAIFEQSDNRPTELEIVLANVGDRCQGFVAVKIDTMLDSAVKSRLGPFLAVMRVVFRRLRAEHSQSVLTVRFSYDQR